jgi:putative intracellular protease/amidase
MNYSIKKNTASNWFILCCAMLVFSINLAAQTKKISNMKKKVLFVVTSHDTKGSTGQPTGYYLSEVAHPWEVLTNAGYEIDFVSPKGGKAPVDGLYLNDETNKKFWEDKTYRAKVENTMQPKDVNPNDYVAIHYAGGHGTMWDFEANETIANLATKIYEANGVVSAVCHGPAGLVNIKLSNGSYLVAGKKINAFTNEEEVAVGLEKVVPFMLETKLIERGAKFEKSGLWQNHVVVDQRVVTGQNPASAKSVGLQLLNEIQKLALQKLMLPEAATNVLGVRSNWLINDEAAPNKAIKQLLFETANATELKNKYVAIVVTDGVEEIELTFVKTILQERGATVHIISPRKPNYPSMFGAYIPEKRATHISTVNWMENASYIKIDKFLDEAKITDYSLVYIPGGAWNPDALRADKDALAFIKQANEKKITLASICHGPWVLISAGLVKNTKVTAWWNMHEDLKNAGGTVIDEPLVIDKNIITARGPIDLAPFTKALIEVLKK